MSGLSIQGQVTPPIASVRLEIRRLDLAERNLWEKLEAAGTTAQRLSAANGLLDISERRAKLLGLDRAG